MSYGANRSELVTEPKLPPGGTAMAKDKSRGKDKGKAKKKKAQAPDAKKPAASRFAGLYDRPKKPQPVPAALPPSPSPPAPPAGG
jgi:hypothetical protein